MSATDIVGASILLGVAVRVWRAARRRSGPPNIVRGVRTIDHVALARAVKAKRAK